MNTEWTSDPNSNRDKNLPKFNRVRYSSNHVAPSLYVWPSEGIQSCGQEVGLGTETFMHGCYRWLVCAMGELSIVAADGVGEK